MRIAIAQLPVPAGDLQGNRERILDAAEKARKDGASVMVAPEMVLSGYPIDDLIGNPAFMDDVEKEITHLVHSLPPEILVAFGSPIRVSSLPPETKLSHSIDANERAHINALVLVRNHEIVGYVAKSLLPTYGVFDDARWFVSAETPAPLISVGETKIGFAICEDVWRDEVVDQLASAGADLVLVANASPYAEGKAEKRETLIREHAQRNKIPIVYVNAVGGQDEVVYDGGSFAINAEGTLTSRFESFSPLVDTIEVDSIHGNRWVPINDSCERTYLALTVAMRDYVDRSRMQGIVVGLSGGLDSALAATIAVDALGANRVRGYAMPGPYSSDHSLNDARELATNLGILFDVLTINETYEMEKTLLGEKLTSGVNSKIADENIQARLRALHLMTLANAHNLIVLNTGNKSETSVGYFTLGGDSSGGYAILKDVYKTRAYALAEWRNETNMSFAAGIRPIPLSTITKPPSAELAPGQEDTDSLPPYPTLDIILAQYLEENTHPKEIALRLQEETGMQEKDSLAIVLKIINMVITAEHKRRQVAPGVKITDKAYGRDRRYPIANGYRLF